MGVVAVHLYRPFKAEAFISAIPKTAKRIAVLDRTKEAGALGQPLYLNVKDCFYGKPDAPDIVGGIYGLSSKDTTPVQIISVYENLAMKMSKNDFTIGIVDDVTFKSLPVREEISMDETTYEAKFYGLGSDDTVGANKMQFLKALKEAESYKGPSLIIAYSPCISHGLKRGMGTAQSEEKFAVECGYWHLWRYDPRLEDEGKNPFILDSKEPKWDKFDEFLKGEVRYTALEKTFPKDAQELYKAAKENAQWRYRTYKRMAEANYSAPAVDNAEVVKMADEEN